MKIFAIAVNDELGAKVGAFCFVNNLKFSCCHIPEFALQEQGAAANVPRVAFMKDEDVRAENQGSRPNRS